MDAVFIFLISTGFVEGMFGGLRKTTKKILSLCISLGIVFLLIPIVVNILIKQGFLKNELYEFLSTKVFSLDPIFSIEFGGGVVVSNLIKDSQMPGIFKTILAKFYEIYPKGKNLGDVVFNMIYRIAMTIIVAITLFAIVFIIFKLIFSLFFNFKTNDKNLFFTKRFLGAFVGSIKNIVIFFVITIIISYFSSVLGISQLQNILDSSLTMKIGEGVIQKNISAFISGIN